MSTRYSLPCPECSHSNEVTTTQAGQELTCSQCQSTIQAPRLGELKQLSLVSSAKSPIHRETKKGGGLFVAGLLLFLICGIGGGGLWYYGYQKLVPYDVEEFIEDTSQQIDELGINDLVGVYSEMPVDKGLGPWRERTYVSSDKQGKILIQISYGLMAVGAIGLLMVLAGLFR